MFDNVRDPYNAVSGELYADDYKVEHTTDDDSNFLSNGFKIIRAATNFDDKFKSYLHGICRAN